MKMKGTAESIRVAATRRGPNGQTWRRMICGCAAGALLASGAAHAQTALPETTAGESATNDIIVTASRISRSGFTAPTPTTIVTMEDVAREGVTNIADALNMIPSFLASSRPATSGNSSSFVGGNFLNLRGLGPSRTLVLVNGRRHAPSTTNGLVDISLIPQALIERTEVVTGGASAAWGSDAVSGVVNFILNSKLEGLQGSAQYGLSQRGDDKQYRAALTYGTSFADGRGHFVIAGEISSNKGILNQSQRKWGRKEWQVIGNPTPGNGQPNLIIASDVHQSNRSEGGLIVGGRYAGTQFFPGGTYGPFRYGSPRNGNFMVGGDGINQGYYSSLITPVDRKTISSILTYDFSDAVTATIEASFGQSDSVNEVTQPFSFAPYTIQRDNAFLPAALAAGMAPGEVIPLGRLSTDFGFITADTSSRTYRGVAALDGQFGEGWKWSAYYQYGQTDYRGLLLRNPIVANLNRSIDAVINPLTGKAVCRSSLTDPSNGCVPINLFGNGSPSKEALAYVLGTQRLDQRLRQQAAGLSLQGEPFSTWAGPVSVAGGAEYRRESADLSVNPTSQAGGYLIGNPKALNGNYNVKEAFAEVVVPLLADSPFAKLIELNAAARITDYSVSGRVTTWKGGLTYKFSDDLRIRATRSRDIRAPNLGELFAPASLAFAQVRDPRDGSTSLVTVNIRGNLGLAPEKADTLTAGIVWQPSFISGLRAAVDYYDIRVKGSIASLQPQDIVNRCESGATALCANVTRNASNVISSVVTSFLNVSSVKTRGVDFELSYVTPLNGISSALSGELRTRLLGTYIARYTTNDGRTAVVNRAGELGPLNGGLPSWQLNGNITYVNDPFTLSLTGRFIGAGKYENTFVQGKDINDNHVPSRVYFNGSMEYTVLDNGKNKVQIFGVVNNILDKDPPIVPATFQSALATNTVLYDTIGRSFVAGVRFKM